MDCRRNSANYVATKMCTCAEGKDVYKTRVDYFSEKCQVSGQPVTKFVLRVGVEVFHYMIYVYVLPQRNGVI